MVADRERKSQAGCYSIYPRGWKAELT